MASDHAEDKLNEILVSLIDKTSDAALLPEQLAALEEEYAARQAAIDEDIENQVAEAAAEAIGSADPAPEDPTQGVHIVSPPEVEKLVGQAFVDVELTLPSCSEAGLRRFLVELKRAWAFARAPEPYSVKTHVNRFHDLSRQIAAPGGNKFRLRVERREENQNLLDVLKQAAEQCLEGGLLDECLKNLERTAAEHDKDSDVFKEATIKLEQWIMSKIASIRSTKGKLTAKNRDLEARSKKEVEEALRQMTEAKRRENDSFDLAITALDQCLGARREQAQHAARIDLIKNQAQWIEVKTNSAQEKMDADLVTLRKRAEATKNYRVSRQSRDKFVRSGLEKVSTEIEARKTAGRENLVQQSQLYWKASLFLSEDLNSAEARLVSNRSKVILQRQALTAELEERTSRKNDEETLGSLEESLAEIDANQKKIDHQKDLLVAANKDYQRGMKQIEKMVQSDQVLFEVDTEEGTRTLSFNEVCCQPNSATSSNEVWSPSPKKVQSRICVDVETTVHSHMSIDSSAEVDGGAESQSPW